MYASALRELYEKTGLMPNFHFSSHSALTRSFEMFVVVLFVYREWNLYQNYCSIVNYHYELMIKILEICFGIQMVLSHCLQIYNLRLRKSASYYLISCIIYLPSSFVFSTC